MEKKPNGTTIDMKEIVELYKFFLEQPTDVATEAWLIEYIERKKAYNFIRQKGLYAEFQRTI